mmetsp:Transcript_73433/g.192564  ORF Transcript_73433/g.192564 Transcript_73433/m.192564 type:complete len:306 (-) Transcript_73433:66-983(-)
MHREVARADPPDQQTELVRLPALRVLERQVLHQHVIRHHADPPEVHRLRVLALEGLRSHEDGRAADLLRLALRRHHAQTVVDDLDVRPGAPRELHHVRGLQVAVQDGHLKAVAVVDGEEHLSHVVGHAAHLHAAGAVMHLLLQVPSGEVLEDDQERLVGLEVLEEAHDVGVVQRLQDCDLVPHHVLVLRGLLTDRLADGLPLVLLVRQRADGPERALADLAEHEVVRVQVAGVPAEEAALVDPWPAYPARVHQKLFGREAQNLLDAEKLGDGLEHLAAATRRSALLALRLLRWRRRCCSAAGAAR